jgi:hypothetical protein
MAIVRQKRPEGNFYILDKAISEDRRLSWSARGVLIFLLGKPDHWKVSIQNLINETEEADPHSRRDAIYKILAELQRVGYVSKTQPKHDDGSFGEIDYLVGETCSPLTDIPETVPLPDLPYTAEPLTADPYLVSTDVLVKNKKRASIDMRFDPKSYLASLGVEDHVCDDWLALRKTKKAPATKTAIDGTYREALKAKFSMNDAIRECCSRGWQGFKSDWVQGQHRKPTWYEENDRVIAELTGRNRKNEPDDGYIDV